MPVDVSLHTHTSEGSSDAVWSDREASDLYRRRGMVTAVTDHDEWTQTDRIVGVEHTVERGPKLHVVELSNGFRFLAHPSYPFPRDTRERAAAFVREHGLDGVEKYNAGVKQYDGSIPGVVELANDDAHNLFQAGSSYMRVNVDTTNEMDIMSAIKREDFTMHTDDSVLSHLCGRVSKATSIAVNGTLPGARR